MVSPGAAARRLYDGVHDPGRLASATHARTTLCRKPRGSATLMSHRIAAALMLIRFCALAIVAALAACSADVDVTTTRTAPVVHGDDDRVEVSDAPDPLATFAIEHAVAMVPRARLTDDGATWSVDAPTTGERHDLCESEAFAEQTALARCSAFWIDDDLVVTAGHCMRTTADCASHLFVAGWHIDEGEAPAVFDDDDVYRCQRIAYVNARDDNDHAVIQLDRARPTPALSLATGAPDDGERLSVVGSPWGLPTKIDDGARAGVTDGARFALAADTFAGSSGSAVLDADLRWQGVIVGGAPDLVRDGACNRINVLRDDARSERAILASVVVDDLCALGWPSERWCGIAATCGDGVCSPDETCAIDCDAPPDRCGDGVCGPTEDTSCADCRFDAPEGFTCDPVFYDAGDGCDCECGVVDPDCESGTTVVHGCGADEVCVDGTCVDVPDEAFDVPDGWRCNPGWYDAGDGCDCACGAVDPDCSGADAELFGCNPGQVCAAGECVFDDSGVPEQWTCNPTWYDAGDDCDCSCGAWDPDCADASLTVLGCDDGQVCGFDGECLEAATGAPKLPRGCATTHRSGAPLILVAASVVGLCRRRRS